MTVSRQKADQLFDALDAFAVSIGSQAASENELLHNRWPYYTIPNWSVKAERLVNLLGATIHIMNFSPIVQEREKSQWANFAQRENPIWYQESIENERANVTTQYLLQRTVPFIYTYDILNNFLPAPVRRSGEVLPSFQQYPIGVNPATNTMTTGYD